MSYRFKSGIRVSPPSSTVWACRSETFPERDANPDIPILKQAKAEYAKLR